MLLPKHKKVDEKLFFFFLFLFLTRRVWKRTGAAKAQKKLPYKDWCEWEAVYINTLKTQVIALFQKSKWHYEDDFFFLLPDLKAYQMGKIPSRV